MREPCESLRSVVSCSFFGCRFLGIRDVVDMSVYQGISVSYSPNIPTP
ncbi:hypothetical protein HMPREF1861_00879 [Corynebacterium kroppenstedtii]|nr:hypothetical protein HMPREF1861_00879 [Corynebacterium kroppenstedtii]